MGIVISQLRPADFIATKQEGNALGQHKRRQQIAPLTRTQRIYGLIRRAPFSAAVPGTIVVLSIQVEFAVSGIVFFVIGDKVSQGKAVMTRNEIDAGRWPAPFALVEIRTAGQPIAEVTQRSIAAAPVVAHRVAEFP